MITEFDTSVGKATVNLDDYPRIIVEAVEDETGREMNLTQDMIDIVIEEVGPVVESRKIDAAR